MHSFYKRKNIVSWKTVKDLKKRTSHGGTVICELIRLKRTWIRVCRASGMSWRLSPGDRLAHGQYLCDLQGWWAGRDKPQCELLRPG